MMPPVGRKTQAFIQPLVRNTRSTHTRRGATYPVIGTRAKDECVPFRDHDPVLNLRRDRSGKIAGYKTRRSGEPLGWLPSGNPAPLPPRLSDEHIPTPTRFSGASARRRGSAVLAGLWRQIGPAARARKEGTGVSCSSSRPQPLSECQQHKWSAAWDCRIQNR